MNQLTIPIVGNLTADPEVRFSKSGVAVCRFTVVHNPRRFDKLANEWIEGEPTFFDCTAWRQLAEHATESLRRGMRVILIGNLRTDRWESDGTGKTPVGEKIVRQVIDVMAVGPDLAFATATVNKATRTRDGETAPDDPWATASKSRGTVLNVSDNDEPPF